MHTELETDDLIPNNLGMGVELLEMLYDLGGEASPVDGDEANRYKAERMRAESVRNHPSNGSK